MRIAPPSSTPNRLAAYVSVHVPELPATTVPTGEMVAVPNRSSSGSAIGGHVGGGSKDSSSSSSSCSGIVTPRMIRTLIQHSALIASHSPLAAKGIIRPEEED